MKIVMLRESYLKRLARVLKNQKGQINLNVIGLIDTLRETSVEALELIQEWERTQFDYPTEVKPFTWNGQCYAEKMCEDYQFLEEFPTMSNWLGFSPEANPFFIPPEAMTNEMEMVPNSFIVFGVRPPEPPKPPQAKAIMPKFVKSPYLTPIHNDLDVFPQNSLVAKSKKKDKIRAIAQASVDNEQKLAIDRAQDAPTDPWQTFISREMVHRAMKTRTYLISKFPKQNMSIDAGYSPSSSLVTAMDMPRDLGSPEEGSFEGDSPETRVGLNGRESERNLVNPQATMRRKGSATSPPHNFVPTSVPAMGDVTTETAAGHLASTSLFSQEQSAFDESHEPFRASLMSTMQRDSLDNPAMRMNSIRDVVLGELSVTDVRTDGYQSFLLSTSQSHGNQSMTGSTSSHASQYWTPHEIKLQKAVRRRGGELFVLTAAGTKGRVKAPWRRTRYQRLSEDLQQMEIQRAEVERTLQQRWTAFNELQRKEEGDVVTPFNRQKRNRNLKGLQDEIIHLEDSRKGIDQWMNTLKLQYNAYKTVINVDDLADLQKQRDMHTQLGDGQALEEDEMKAQRLEDRMAQVIQRSMKKALGKSIRRAIIRKRHAAAQVIQNLVRKKANEGLAFERGIRVTLAVKVQRLWRGRGGKEASKRMAVEQARRGAGQLLTRLARGYLARKITKRKRVFIRAVISAQHEVGLDCVNPDDLEKLADTIEEFQKNFTLTIPMEVISVLRGLLYMFIGDEEDFVTVDNSGYVEPVSIFAGTAGWNTQRLLLRRKGKYLRRIRAIINHLSPPGPRRLEFSTSCLRHLEAVRKIRVAVFDHLNPKDRQTMIHFYKYIVNIKTAYDMQIEFPEYFVPVMPQWYKNLNSAERAHQDAQNERRVQKYVASAVDEIRKKYVDEGKAWRFVANALKINERDTERAERLIEKTSTEYDRLLYFFEKDESLNLQLKEGFVKSNEFGAIVAERDFKSFMDKEGDYAPEWRIAEMRLTVDKAHLKLLEAQNDLFFAKRARNRDLEARNWKKHINLRFVHEMCRDEGVILGKLYIIKQDWQKFVRRIGGVQYVFDLRGEDLTYYEDTKKIVLKLLAKRRELHAKRNKEMFRQFDKAAQTAHEARISEKTNTWDFPTDMESKAEKEEDKECRMRDADLEAKEARAAKRLRIPAAPFRPMMLLIDMRVPKSVARVLRDRLYKLHFREVGERIDNPELTLRVQSFMDQHLNVFMFVDRGTNVTSRSFFLGYFRSLLYSLIPTPRVVAVDAFLEMRLENWHTDNAADYQMLYSYNKNDSTRATLALGRLRRTAMLFRQFLLMETAGEEKAAGCFEIMPEWLRPVFRNDLDDFISEIENGNDDARIAGDDANTYMSVRTAMEHGGMILAATISMLLDLWSSPVLEWKAEQVAKGCSIFLNKIKDAPTLIETLWLKRFPPTTVKQRRRIARATMMAPVWREITRCNFYEQPARYLLARWALETMELVESLVDQGGGIDENFENSTKVSYARNLDWRNDVSLDSETIAEQLVGELLESAMEDSLVYERVDAPVVEYFKRDELEDVQSQFFTAQKSSKRVRVYHSHTCAFVCVSVNGHYGRDPIWHSFDSMEMVDFVSMLQPNNTELYDGTVTNYDVGESGKDKWWEVISNWARLERNNEKHNMTLLRSRTLILTKIGFVNGHMCRFEIFEERVGELLILIHGLDLNTGTVYLRINRETYASLLAVADHDIEKSAIELKEAVPIAYLSTDRIQVKPSRSQLRWLTDGELEPKCIWSKPLTVSLRLKGGPGRLVGRKLFNYHGIRLCITIFEVTSASDITQLRLLIYELEHSQTIEIRLSDLEKIMLFNDLSPMIDQVLNRMRTVFCKTDADSRGVMLFRQDFRPSEFPDYVVEGDEEYDIMDDISLQNARRHAGSDGTKDEEDTEIEEGASSLRKKSSSYSGLGSLMPSDLVKIDAEVSESDSEQDEATVEEEAKPWHWALYFHRSIVDELMGNLTVSINLNLSLEGFEFIVFDNRTLFEVYRLVVYEDLLPFFYGMSKPEFYKSLQAMDETVVMEITEELYQVLEIEEGLDSDGVGVLRMQLNAGTNEDEPLVICHLREHEVTKEDMSRRSKKESKLGQMSKTRLHVLAAQGLASVSGVAARCPIAITKWNMREVHRTLPVRNDLDPKWNDAPVFMNSTRDKLLWECFLEIEVWDWNFQKAKPQDFLGCARFSGEQILDIFRKGAKRQTTEAPLGRSPRFSAAENLHVQGSIVLFGVKDEDIDKIPESKIPQEYRINGGGRKSGNESNIEEQGEGRTPSMGMFGWGNSKKAEVSSGTVCQLAAPGESTCDNPESGEVNEERDTPVISEALRDQVRTRSFETFNTEAALSPSVRKHSIHIQNLLASASTSKHVVQIPHQRVRFSLRHKFKANLGGAKVGNALLNYKGHTDGDQIPPRSTLSSPLLEYPQGNRGRGAEPDSTAGGLRKEPEMMPSPVESSFMIEEEGNESDEGREEEHNRKSLALAHPSGGGVHGQDLLEGSQLTGKSLDDYWQEGGMIGGGIDKFGTFYEDGYDEDEKTLATKASLTLTDDTYTVVNKNMRKRLRMELLQIEGVPITTKSVMVVAKFNGYVVGRSPIVATVPSVTLNSKTGMLQLSTDAQDALLRSKKRGQVKIGNARTLEDKEATKTARIAREKAAEEKVKKRNEKVAKAAKETAKAGRRAQRDENSVGEDNEDEEDEEEDDDDGTGGESMGNSKITIDEESFVSDDRLEEDEESEVVQENGKIPERVRREDKGNLVLFPTLAPILMTVPADRELGSCCVELEVWDMDSTEIVGTADLRGSRLVAFVDGGSSANPGLDGEWVPVTDSFSGHTASYRSWTGVLVDTRIMTRGDDPDMATAREYLYYELAIFSLAGIPRYLVVPEDAERGDGNESAELAGGKLASADHFQDDIVSINSEEEETKRIVLESSGMLVRIFFNGAMVGESNLLHGVDEDGSGSNSWSWQPVPKFRLRIRVQEDIRTCTLRFEAICRVGTGVLPSSAGAAAVSSNAVTVLPGATAIGQAGVIGKHFNETTMAMSTVTGNSLVKLLGVDVREDEEVTEAEVDDNVEVDETGVVDMQALLAKETWEPQEYKGGMTRRIQMMPLAEADNATGKAESVNSENDRSLDPLPLIAKLELIGLPATLDAVLDDSAQSITTRVETLSEYSADSKYDEERIERPYTPNPVLTPAHLKGLGTADMVLASPPGSANTVVAGWTSRPGTGPIGLGREISSPADLARKYPAQSNNMADAESDSDLSARGQRTADGRRERAGAQPTRSTQMHRIGNAPNPKAFAKKLELAAGGGQNLLLNSAAQLFKAKHGVDEKKKSDPEVTVMRQNCMTEVQDMPQRRMILTLRAIEIQGRKPTGLFTNTTNMFGTGNKSASGIRRQSVKLVASQSRISRGLQVLKRYVDCAKRVALDSKEKGVVNTGALAHAETEAGRLGASRERPHKSTANLLTGAGLPGDQSQADSVGSVPGPQLGATVRRANRRASTFGHTTAAQRHAVMQSRKRLFSIASQMTAEIEGSSKASAAGEGASSMKFRRVGDSNEALTSNDNLEENLDEVFKKTAVFVHHETAPQGNGIAFDHLSFREVQVFFNGRFVHEVTVPIRYTESLDAFHGIFTAAANASLAEDDQSPRSVHSSSTRSPTRSTKADLRVDTASLEPNNTDVGRDSAADENPFEEKVKLFVPRGQALDGCRLELVIWHLDNNAKKLEIMGLRLFEGEDLKRLFTTTSAPNVYEEDRELRPKTAADLDAYMSSRKTEHPSTISTPTPGDLARPNTAPQDAFTSVGVGDFLDATSPRTRRYDASKAKLYEMEAPPGDNNDNAEGIALSTEKVELSGAGEPDYTNVTSGLDLGVHNHSRGEYGLRKVEVRLLSLQGMLEGLETVPGVPMAQFPDLINQSMSSSGDHEEHSAKPMQSHGNVNIRSDNDNVPIAPMLKAQSRGFSALGMLRSLTSRGKNSSELFHSVRNLRSGDEYDDNLRIQEEEEREIERLHKEREREKAEEAADTNREYVYVSVRWNGQEIRASQPRPLGNTVIWGHQEEEDEVLRRKRLKKKKITGEALQRLTPDGKPLPPQVDAVGASVFKMYVPRGHRLRGCYLELVVWSLKSDTALGSVMLHGDDLVGFLEGHGSVVEDDDLFEDYDEGDAAGYSMHRTFPLKTTGAVPEDLKSPQLRGRIVLRARCESERDLTMIREGKSQSAGRMTDSLRRHPFTLTNPHPESHNQLKGQVRLKKRTLYVPMFKIRSKLRRGRTGWRHFYSIGERKRVDFLERLREEEDTRLNAMSPMERAVYMKKLDEEQHEVDQQILETRRASLADGMRRHEWLRYHVEEQRTGKFLPVKMEILVNKYHLALSAVKYQKASEAQEEDCRVCWRGRAMPKHFKGGLSEKTKETMMKSRASRLIRTTGMGDLKMTADVHYLKDTDAASTISNEALPIVVKEIVSTGPGLCTRVYRITIETNSGQIIGHTDLSDDTDVIRVVGEKASEIFGEDGRDRWNMKAIFEHIIQERTIIDFMSDQKKKHQDVKLERTDKVTGLSSFFGANKKSVYKKSSVGAQGESIQQSRRGGISSSNSKEGGNQVITVKRDEIITAGTRFKAVYGLHTFHRDLNAYEDNDMRDEARRASAIQDSQLAAEKLAQKCLAAIEEREKQIEDRRAREIRDPFATNTENREIEDDNVEYALNEGIGTDSTHGEEDDEEDEDELDSVDRLSLSDQEDADFMDSDSDESSTIVSESVDVPTQYLRIHTRTKKLSGVEFKCTIMLSGRIAKLWSAPNEYFEQEGLSNEDVLFPLGVEFRFNDTFTKRTHNISYTGQEILGWFSMVPDAPKIQLETNFRRNNFGDYLLRNTVMRYTHTGDYTFDLINDLIGEVTKQGMGGAAAGFTRNLHTLADGDRRRAEEREAQKKRNIRLRKEAKYRRIKEIEREKAEIERKLKEEVDAKAKEKQQQSSMFGSFGFGGGGKEKTQEKKASSSLGSMFGWGK